MSTLNIGWTANPSVLTKWFNISKEEVSWLQKSKSILEKEEKTSHINFSSDLDFDSTDTVFARAFQLTLKT